MKQYIYETLEGNIAIEVDEKWYDWLTEADKAEASQERSHNRPDHKYAPGTPVSLDAEDSLDDWLVFSTLTSYAAVELRIDLELAFELLTPLQRQYFTMNRLHGYSSHAIAKLEGKAQPVIFRTIMLAERKIKNFFLS